MAQTLIAGPVNREVSELRIAELEMQLAAERALLERPAEPLLVGTVVRFRKFSGGYTFAAIRAYYTDPFSIGVWYLTQDGTRNVKDGKGHPAKTWAELLTFIGERNWHTIEVLS